MAAAPMSVPRMTLGSQGLEVSAQGLRSMGMSAFYGAPKPEPDMIALVRHAAAAGVTFLDTSDVYGPHTNELLLGKALQGGGVREKVQLATKFGISSDCKREVHGDPAYVRVACEGSLRRLGVDCIDLYYQHRVDKRVPIEVTVGELKKLVEEGKIKYIRLSEASASTIRRAHAVHPITAVQVEWSLWSRDVEEDIVPTCRELGIGIVAYSPLGRGFLSGGPKLIDTLPAYDHRKKFPRFQPENLVKNAQIFERVDAMATRKGCTASQLALAWVHHQGSDVCPIPYLARQKLRTSTRMWERYPWSSQQRRWPSSSPWLLQVMCRVTDILKWATPGSILRPLHYRLGNPSNQFCCLQLCPMSQLQIVGQQKTLSFRLQECFSDVLASLLSGTEVSV